MCHCFFFEEDVKQHRKFGCPSYHQQWLLGFETCTCWPYLSPMAHAAWWIKIKAKICLIIIICKSISNTICLNDVISWDMEGMWQDVFWDWKSLKGFNSSVYIDSGTYFTASTTICSNFDKQIFGLFSLKVYFSWGVPFDAVSLTALAFRLWWNRRLFMTRQTVLTTLSSNKRIFMFKILNML